MPDVYFKCACGKSLAVDAQGSGLVVPCPDCGDENVVPPPDISWQCDYCDSELSAPKKMVEDSVQCLNCRRIISVPKPGLIDVLPVASGQIIRQSSKILSKVARAGVAALKNRKHDKALCNSCGSEIIGSSVFCGSCGAKLSEPASSPVRLKPDVRPQYKKQVTAKPVSERRVKLPMEKIVGIAACIAVVAIVWANRDEIPGLIEDAKPGFFNFLEKARIYRVQKPDETTSVSGTDSASEQVPEGFDMENVGVMDHESEFDVAVFSEEETVAPEHVPELFVTRDEKLEAQLKFLEARTLREEERLARIEKLKQLQAEAAGYSSVVPGDFVALDGQVYRRVQLKRVEPDGISITHATGAGEILFKELPASLAARFGYQPEPADYYARSAADTMELAKALLGVKDEKKTENAVAMLVEAMRKHPAAVNMNQADAMLEELLVNVQARK